MSVRKRTWFTSLQREKIDPKAKEIAIVKGKSDDWREYIDRAAELLGIQPQESWIVDYSDQGGKRHIKTFGKKNGGKKAADAYVITVGHQLREGTHTAPSKSITVLEAAGNWLKHVEREGRERATLAQYGQHVHRHLKPLHHFKLASLTTPRIN